MGALTLRRAAIVCGLATLAMVSVRTARGAPSRLDDEKESRRLFQKAELGFNLGKFEDALADYQAAYQAKPLPGFLFNIAQCYRNLTNYERARFFYRRYLKLEPRSPNRHLVEQLIAEMTERMDKQAAQTAGATPPPPPSLATEERATSPAPPVAPPVAEPAAPLAPPDVPAAGVAPALVLPAASPEPEGSPIWERWWFWAGLGTVVAGGAVAAFLLTRDDAGVRGTLMPIDGR
jgi:tetratricopeptide (TPR) repeat protein